MIDLTVWTSAGVVDVVALSRFLQGETTVRLSEAEALVAYQAVKAGRSNLNVRQFERACGLNAGRLNKTPTPTLRRGSQRIVLIPCRKVQP